MIKILFLVIFAAIIWSQFEDKPNAIAEPLPILEQAPQVDSPEISIKPKQINPPVSPEIKTAAPDYQCDGKKVCAEMRSCGEAMFYLHQCSKKRLDHDKDGIPCEQKWCNKKAEGF